ncbi:MAG: 6-phospho-3-hexuloisomerase [Desulfurococcaceae archaeon]|nr:6-phospho-3-hexuloisomerase [Desulfurococcaceae archaeon]
MKVFKESVISIASYIANSVNIIKEYQVEDFLKNLIEIYKEGRKVLVVGAGRSGLIGRAFAMRLMHLGFNVYVLGDTVVPPLRAGDALIAISGSGRTRSVITVAEAAKSVGAKVIALTTYINSPLAKLSDIIVEIPGRTKVSSENDYYTRQLIGIYEPLAPLGTLFELVAMVVLDAVVAELMVQLGKTEEDLKKLHANIEI